MILKNREIKKIKVKPPVDSNSQSLCVETTEHLRNRMRKENVFKSS